ncbi:MAG: RNA polymerase-binding protein DksA [Burkholderiales bacterium]|jgi:DnaK suppressor protein|nr:RNA polymerase-binding protein DksA [Burkholderiales bacterium]
MVAKAKTAKPAKKTAGRTATASRPAKAPAKKAARPAPRAAAKPAAKAAPKAVPKSAPKAAPKAAAKVSPRSSSKAAPVAAKTRGAARPAPEKAPAAATAASSRPAPSPRPVAAASAKEVAAAHEYLLSRSANRSEEPIVLNGRRLPTEEQLLRMPDSAYMNDEQLAFFKYRLQRMEKELLANAGETTEHLRETVIVPDPADRATIEEEHALELRTRDRERKLLKKVQSALQRIESGDYGFCEETGDPIGIPRLLARPTATLSLEAQQRRELKQKLFGD